MNNLEKLLEVLEEYLKMKSFDGKAERQELRARLAELLPLVKTETRSVWGFIADEACR